MTTIAAIAEARAAHAHVSAPRTRRTTTSPAAWAARAAITAVAVLCVGMHLWLAVAAPDWRSLAMLGLAAACAACLLHRGRTALPSTGEWGLMAVVALMMLVIHLSGAGVGGHHGAPAVAIGADASAGVGTGSATAGVHEVAGVIAAAEFGVAMLALAIGGVRRRAARRSHR